MNGDSSCRLPWFLVDVFDYRRFAILNNPAADRHNDARENDETDQEKAHPNQSVHGQKKSYYRQRDKFPGSGDRGEEYRR